MYEETFSDSSDTTQYYIRIESDSGEVYDGFLWDEQVKQIIELIEKT